MPRDNIYALPRDQVGSFQFDDHVAEVFPDMISRSVPGYTSILSVIEQLAERLVQPASNVYDLGCSLGAATTLIRGKAPADATIYAIDNSEAMIRRLRDQLAGYSQTDTASVSDLCDVIIQQQDLCDTEMSNASMVVLNFTLQFIAAEKRTELLSRCFDAMIPGGGLVLSEKICFDDPAEQDLLAELHLDFKRACGYSELEIAQKRTSLENTLIPETLQTHISRLQQAGFQTVTPWFQCFNFVSILAIKSR
ncbi:carboxy-S-adenosyl-L-methionine synthase CmoA [Rhodopirellula sp. MGV]|uniref:carboxy-S-adenosyl-L-methionine synthase CmoA n=1 Tax=Rhodopirellula sp. MGV TaxID=2023130 RepID=UPI000B96235D|nr:carboxy-S-adenosyl-L-methionine synthase CmoA [Rhodopirellula sp. MGV]OYP28506.1 carboxy-S-adenosyl-L-methionine synthase CmoA [Rhodopirellula sp. MGV]PNY38920.1 carboxy-S-adenosyl-L-methionine synthase CmoA [Rhodopirellula baltica]